MAGTQNIVGAEIRRLRYLRDMSQDQLAAKLQLSGLELSRGTLSKIEAGLRCVADYELPIIAKALRVGIEELFPETARDKRRRGRE
jgi:transcriptional regulator with XRE-family HTH domain